MNRPASPSDDQNPQLIHWLLLAFLSLVWGSSYILIKRGLEVFTPPQLACLRIVISFLAFLPIFIVRFRKIDWSKFKYLAIVGFSGSFFPSFLFALAQTELSSSTTGVLSSLTPLFTLMLGILLFGLPLVWSKVVGVAIGLSGAVLLILFGGGDGLSGNPWYGLLVLLGCFLYATSSNTVKVYLQEINTITLSAAAFVIIGFPTLPVLFYTDFVSVMQEVEGAWAALGYVSILALFGTVLASILFFRLVQLTNAVFGSMVSYLIPMVALGWGLLDGEFIGWFHFIGMVLILIGVYISGK
ncbi:MAG: DMT family transporter [Bacteroidota bacterium]